MENWISVKEELPKKNGNYFVHYKLYETSSEYTMGVLPFICNADEIRNNDNDALRYIISDFDGIECNNNFCIERSSYEEWWHEICTTVTHWIPLPNPPIVI